MAFSAFLSKANGEIDYQRPSFSVEESVFEKSPTTEPPKFNEILELKDRANQLRVQIEELRLKQVWQDQINQQNTLENLQSIENQLQSILESKSTCLNILRNPQSSTGNSLSLSRDSQSKLSEAFEILGKIIDSKQEHLANSSWILNQNWSLYGQELTNVTTKLLRVEANLAKSLENIDSIRSTVAQNNSNTSLIK